MGEVLSFNDNYSPIGDLIVIATCVVILVLAYTSFVGKNRAFLIFNAMIGCLLVASFSDVIFHNIFTDTSDATLNFVYLFRLIYHAMLFLILFNYVLYVMEVLRIETSIKKKLTIVGLVVFLIITGVDAYGIVTGKGFHINKDASINTGKNFFALGYIFYMALIVYIMVFYRGRIYKKVMRGFFGTMAVSMVVLAIQGSHQQRSFTTATFLFPIIAMLYLVHSNPYDIELGAVSTSAMEDMVRYNYEKKNTLVIMSLYMKEFEEERKTFPKELQAVIRQFAGTFFKGAVLFQVSTGHMVLMAEEAHNKGYENTFNRIISAFTAEYEKYGYDFKVVYGLSKAEISMKNDYVNFLKYIYKNMAQNSFHEISDEDVKLFQKNEYILKELADICRGGNTRDPRVLAYCQPVFNVKTGRYDTAEALMRLKLQDTGMVYPDQFIGLAEENGYIHSLTRIILQKTCDEIKYLLNEGFLVNRISVNISMQELHDDNFCDDIIGIIEGSGIPDHKIAIEITESQNESDFEAMKSKIDILKEKGIKFYLDDFGTGYSNMERIMELPFDIIKFDRSLVIASNINRKSERMVGGLANMFAEMNYSVLYEGVEDEKDKKRCVNMAASYLQGYKYSKPIPIMDLKNYFARLDETA